MWLEKAKNAWHVIPQGGIQLICVLDYGVDIV